MRKNPHSLRAATLCGDILWNKIDGWLSQLTMKPTTLVGATLLGFVLVGVAPATSTHAQNRRSQPRSQPRSQQRTERAEPHVCVGFTQQTSQDGRSITMALNNRCSQDVESTISWRLVCGDSPSGTPIERVEHMMPQQNKTVVATVDACGSSSYRIEGIRWSWRFAPAE